MGSSDDAGSMKVHLGDSLSYQRWHMGNIQCSTNTELKYLATSNQIPLALQGRLSPYGINSDGAMAPGENEIGP